MIVLFSSIGCGDAKQRCQFANGARLFVYGNSLPQEDCDKTCPYVAPTPTPSPTPNKDNGGTDDEDDYDTAIAFFTMYE